MADNLNDLDHDERAVSLSYLIFSFGMGILIVAVIAFAGASRWPVVPSLLLGTLANTVFKVTKQTWSNALSSGSGHDRAVSGKASWPKSLLLMSIAMFCVTGFWYGVGWGLNWVWDLVF